MDARVCSENDALWARYKEHGDLKARDALVRSYMPWAATVARGVHRKLRFLTEDGDDFVQNASIGLLEAISRYEPARGVTFEAYAQARVRGSIFNGLRAMVGPRPTSRERFQSRLDTLSEGEVGEGDALDRLLEAVSGMAMGYLLEDSFQLVGQAKPIDAFTNAYRIETSRRILSAVSGLSERSRRIVEDHYFRDVPFVDIAKREGVTKGRISQLHKSALADMRRSLEAS